MTTQDDQPILTIDAIFDGLRTTGERFPRAELEAAVAQREAITPRLIQLLEDVARDPRPYLDDQDDYRLLAAVYLLAQFRATHACQALADVIALDDDTVDRLLGETLAERGPMILAAVCGDEPAAIQAILEKPSANVDARNAAARALVALVVHGRWPRAEAIRYFRSLMAERLVREPSHVWSGIVYAARGLHPGDMLTEIQGAYEDDLIEEFFCGDFGDVETLAAQDVEAVLAEARDSETYRWITDVIGEMEWWAAFEPTLARHATPAVRRLSASAEVPVPLTFLGSDRGGEEGTRRPSSTADRAKAKVERKLAKASRRKNR